jgi:hypothetical protein
MRPKPGTRVRGLSGRPPPTAGIVAVLNTVRSSPARAGRSGRRGDGFVGARRAHAPQCGGEECQASRTRRRLDRSSGRGRYRRRPVCTASCRSPAGRRLRTDSAVLRTSCTLARCIGTRSRWRRCSNHACSRTPSQYRPSPVLRRADHGGGSKRRTTASMATRARNIITPPLARRSRRCP